MEGSHSLFGIIWQVVTASGWTLHRVLWRTPYPLLLLMAADAPKYVKDKSKDKQSGTGSMKGSASQIFQTILSQEQKNSHI